MKISAITKRMCSDDQGRLSHSKVWSNLANMISTIIIMYFAYNGTLSDDLLVFWMLILSGHAVSSKLIKNKLSKGLL